MINFNDFITNAKIYNKYSTSTEAMAVFNYLKLQENVDKMVTATTNGKPALEGVVHNLENVFEDNKDFDFAKNEVRQCVGKMVKAIIGPKGYVTDKDMTLSNTKFFKSAMKYTF